jgi:hypothetical protein
MPTRNSRIRLESPRIEIDTPLVRVIQPVAKTDPVLKNQYRFAKANSLNGLSANTVTTE